MNSQLQKRRKALGGFTLVELMVVVSIICILAAIGIPRVFAYVRSSETSEVSQAAGRIAQAIKSYEESQLKSAAAVVTDIDGTEVTPDGSGTTELSTIIPCPSSEFFGELRRFRNGGSGSVSV